MKNLITFQNEQAETTSVSMSEIGELKQPPLRDVKNKTATVFGERHKSFDATNKRMRIIESENQSIPSTVKKQLQGIKM